VSLETSSSWVLAKNGSVYGAGRGITGGMGEITKVHSEFLKGVKAIVSGASHTLFLLDNGVVCGRGEVARYQTPLCNASNSTVIEPVVVMTGVKDIKADNYNSLFLKENNELYGCGHDSEGKFGQDSVMSTRSTPVLIQKDVLKAWVSSSNVVMELLNGSTFVTGSDADFQFGFGSRYRSPKYWSAPPRSEVPLSLQPPEGLKAFGADDGIFWFIAENRTLYGRGRNRDGQISLPKPSNQNDYYQKYAIRVLDNVKAVASDRTGVIFLLQNGTALIKSDEGDRLLWAMDHVEKVDGGLIGNMLLTESGVVYGSKCVSFDCAQSAVSFSKMMVLN